VAGTRLEPMQLSDMPYATHEFLRSTRLGILVHAGEPWPNAVPVWYEWTGSEIVMFSRGGRPKNQRLTDDPRASFLVTAETSEPVYWVVIEGMATIDDDAAELAERMCDKYCDLATEDGRTLKADIMAARHEAVRIRISADRVRHFG